MSFGEERCSSYMLIPPQNHDPAARKRRENQIRIASTGAIPRWLVLTVETCVRNARKLTWIRVAASQRGKDSGLLFEFLPPNWAAPWGGHFLARIGTPAGLPA